MEANALWHINPSLSIIRPQTLGDLRDDECLVQTRFSMVSMGTERLVCRGGIGETAYKQMEVPYMQGEFSFPLTYGYSLTGEVIDGPREWIGERVHCMHPHQDICQVNTKDLTVIPDSVSMDRAVLASNLETAINGIWDGQPMMGQRILVIGYGLIGAMLAQLVKPLPGIELWVKEPHPFRADLARNAGHQIVEKENSASKPFDLVFHTSATSAGLQWAIDASGMEANIIEMSWFGQQDVNLDLGADFHFGRKQIRSSQVSQIARPAQSQFDHHRRKDLVFRILADPIWQSFLGKGISFADSPAFFQELRQQPVNELNAYFIYA